MSVALNINFNSGKAKICSNSQQMLKFAANLNSEEF